MSATDQAWTAYQYHVEMRLAEQERLARSWRLWDERCESERDKAQERIRNLEAVLADLVDNEGTSFERGALDHAKAELHGPK